MVEYIINCIVKLLQILICLVKLFASIFLSLFHCFCVIIFFSTILVNKDEYWSESVVSFCYLCMRHRVCMCDEQWSRSTAHFHAKFVGTWAGIRRLGSHRCPTSATLDLSVWFKHLILASESQHKENNARCLKSPVMYEKGARTLAEISVSVYPSVLWRCWLAGMKDTRPEKTCATFITDVSPPDQVNTKKESRLIQVRVENGRRNRGDGTSWTSLNPVQRFGF